MHDGRNKSLKHELEEAIANRHRDEKQAGLAATICRMKKTIRFHSDGFLNDLRHQAFVVLFFFLGFLVFVVLERKS